MEKINGLRKVLKHPNVIEEVVQRDFTVIKSRIKKRQFRIYLAFVVLMIVHYVGTFVLDLGGIYLSIPAVMLIGFCLLILFFYSFKGGRVMPDIMFDSSDHM